MNVNLMFFLMLNIEIIAFYFLVWFLECFVVCLIVIFCRITTTNTVDPL